MKTEFSYSLNSIHTPTFPVENSETVHPWDQVLATIREKLSAQSFTMWFSPIKCKSITDSHIVLQAPNPYLRDWLETHYLDVILDELEKITGNPFSSSFAPDKPVATPQNGSCESDPKADGVIFCDEESIVEAIGNRKSNPSSFAASVKTKGSSIPFNRKHTFDNFVAGPSNQLAFAAAEAASRGFPPKYNPIFLCGGVGLGKTHLLHAIGNQIAADRPSARVLYISGEHFMNEYIKAIRTHTMHNFRKKYRESCDVFLVDDVQFLAGKGGTQDEFFHTFNALHTASKQIVLTADRKPFEIPEIADRLRSRFAWGLLADVDVPSLEVRIAILRKKAAEESISLDDDIIFYIASTIQSNIRELEGALIRLTASASLCNKTIDLDYAKSVLDNAICRPKSSLTCDVVIKEVCRYYGINPSDIKSSRRHKSISGPRAVAMYLARNHTSQSYPDLGRAFGGKHHTTVISAVGKVTQKLTQSPQIRSEVQSLENLLLHQ